ncbi:MAG TPA: hypothetical protein VGH03_17525 [Caulobacteraceae bacterium]
MKILRRLQRSSKRDTKRQNKPRNKNGRSSNHDAPADNHDSGGAPHHPTIIQPSAEERRHRAHERLFWRRQIRISTGLNYLTGIAGVVGVVGLFFVANTLIETQKATEEANRAWLTVDHLEWHIPPNKVGDTMDIYTRYRNIGKEPAMDTRFYGEFFQFYPMRETDGKFDLRHQPVPPNTTCNDPSEELPLGAVWFDQSQTYGSGGKQSTADPGLFMMREWYGYHGCFEYRTFGKVHYTRFCYVLEPEPGKPITEWAWGLCPGANQQNAN